MHCDDADNANAGDDNDTVTDAYSQSENDDNRKGDDGGDQILFAIRIREGTDASDAKDGLCHPTAFVQRLCRGKTTADGGYGRRADGGNVVAATNNSFVFQWHCRSIAATCTRAEIKIRETKNIHGHKQNEDHRGTIQPTLLF